MSHKCEHEKDSDICVECWEEKNLEPRVMTNEPSELDRAIEILPCPFCGTLPIPESGKVLYELHHKPNCFIGGRIRFGASELERWNNQPAAKRCWQIEQMFTAHSNAELLGETERCQFEALKVKVKQLELDVKLGIESQQEICKERDDLQGGRIDLARQSLALKEQLSQLRESQQVLVKERDSFATTIHQQHFGRYGIVELQQQLFQLRVEYKKALDKVAIIEHATNDAFGSGQGAYHENALQAAREVLTTPLAIETMKDQTI